MKKLKVIGIALIVSAQLSAQDVDIDNVPMEVMGMFNQYYAEATHVTFEMENGNYEVDFKMEGKDYTSLFTTKGDWIETKYDIMVSELPKSVSQSIEKTYPEYKIDDIEKIETPNDGNKYKVEIEKGATEMHLLLNEKGEILKKMND